MILGRVVGTVVTTISHPAFKHRRLLVVQPLGLDGEPPDADFIALDNTQAGVGDTVLVNREGNGARQVLNNPDAPVISVIVGSGGFGLYRLRFYCLLSLVLCQLRQRFYFHSRSAACRPNHTAVRPINICATTLITE